MNIIRDIHFCVGVATGSAIHWVNEFSGPKWLLCCALIGLGASVATNLLEWIARKATGGDIS